MADRSPFRRHASAGAAGARRGEGEHGRHPDAPGRPRGEHRPGLARILLVALPVGMLSLGGMPAALAHADLEASDPAEGEQVAAPPAHVRLTFDEVPATGSRASVFDGCGQDVTAEFAITDRTMEIDTLTGQPGTWSLRYAVLSDADGHPSEGTLTFTVAGSPSCAPPPGSASPATTAPAGPPSASDAPAGEPAPSTGGGAPGGLLTGAVVAALAAGAVAGLLARRGRRR